MTAATDDREIIARLEKIGGGDVLRGLQVLCVTARICSNCGTSWDNPAFACGCANALPDDQKTIKTRGNRP